MQSDDTTTAPEMKSQVEFSLPGRLAAQWKPAKSAICTFSRFQSRGDDVPRLLHSSTVVLLPPGNPSPHLYNDLELVLGENFICVFPAHATPQWELKAQARR